MSDQEDTVSTDTVRTIEIGGTTKHFYEGVAAGSRIRDEHDPVIGEMALDVRLKAFWFYSGVLAGGEYGLTTSEELEAFVQGASCRAPQLDLNLNLVTCDGCGEVSESGWGDTGLCLSCAPADTICREHNRTFVGTCPLD